MRFSTYLFIIAVVGLVLLVGTEILYLEISEFHAEHEIWSKLKKKYAFLSTFVEIRSRDLKLDISGGVGKRGSLHFAGFLEPDRRKSGLPKLAIIIDDLGYDAHLASKFISLPYKVNLAVLPFLRWSNFVSEKGYRGGKEIILHLPMQAYKHVVNRDVVSLGMDMEEIRDLINRALSSVDYAVGVNNHMGSLATTDPVLMRKVMSVLKEKGLFFVDSYTTPDSVAYHIALDVGLPCFYNSLFIDRYSGENRVEEYILKLVSLARRRTMTIGIGHAKSETFNALNKLLPVISKYVEVVFASEIVYHRGEVVKK
ncbi:MAG: divergent polysaccharide deacetylase family protein [Synergistetes bacterium]|nr:divergent polysaccharide deacetylase family protein [Synergistota bacterium]MCX8127650.1 divergent polysaccharide deacetylase family protein [Synergistota bacterium]MDW8191434.1 divergent polysaccharide deacetylase family protein [Synergistota bacterium]